jgi:hypothetical protein
VVERPKGDSLLQLHARLDLAGFARLWILFLLGRSDVAALVLDWRNYGDLLVSGWLDAVYVLVELGCMCAC